ncbi:hypothetical protein RD149_12500 [Gordonia westfalica]|uniref:Uncharacterized protein n=1 Tax=Gordonia westfalica TaxID=158898 RepID=A0ABU2GT14_9ACTN|nr:hypothetical protein [Gordonia westfalica]MDS1114588.1 hypothetical protein [Gordonia westfalica]
MVSAITKAAAAATERRPGGFIALRWLFLVACTVLAFWNTIVAVVEEMRAQTLIVYVPVLIILCVIAAVGVSWRRVDEPPIYDRQTDVIVGMVVLILALAMKSLVNPRYTRSYLTTHMDLLALWLFVLGAAILVFGLRPVARYRWVWLLFLLVFPVPMRAVLLSMGGTSLAAGFILVLVAMAATAIAVGTGRKHKAVAALVAGAVGLVVLGALYLIGVPRNLLIPVPALVAALVTRSLMLYDHRRRGGQEWSPPARGQISAPKVAAVGRPLLVVLVAAIALAFVPTPAVGSTWQSNRYPQLRIGEPLVVPDGWRQESAEIYRWGSKMYGSGAVLVRQVLVQGVGSRAFDKFGRPRRVVVDSVDSRRPLALEVYPDLFRYDLSDERVSEPVAVALPLGVEGKMWNVVDDDKYLTYTVVSWWWNNGSRTQQVMLWAVDNHEPEAYFPQPRITIAANVSALMTVLLRGNAVLLDSNPQYKDRALLVGLAGDLIQTQLDPDAGEKP